MIAIQTKYLPATNTRGSRIKAFTCHGYSVCIPFPYDLSHEQAGFAAVQALVKKYGLDWDVSKMYYGGIKGGYVFCFANSIVEA